MSDININLDEPLNFGCDTTDLDTGFPIIPAGPYPARIQNLEVKQNSRGDGNNLVITYAVEQEVKTESGTLLPAGTFTIKKHYSMAPDQAKYIIGVQDAALGTKKGSRPPFVPSQLIGKLLLLNIRVEPERVDAMTGREYPRGNSVGFVSALKEAGTHSPA